LIKYAYLQRLEERKRANSLKRQIVLGLVLGWFSVLIGAFHIFFVPGANETGWKVLLWAGVFFVCISLVLPSLLSVVEKWWSRGFSGLGSLVFLIILVLVYFSMFWPVGVMLRRLKGNHGFFEWVKTGPQLTTVWEPYESGDDGAEQAVSSKLLLFQPAAVLMFFVRRGQYLFLPALLVLLLLGLALFFVQSSSLAPFVYTLF
jgi:cation transport ATPase